MKPVDPSILKVPPQNLEAEQSVLGGILLENAALNPVLEIMTGSDFYSAAHRKIFAGILELTDRNQPVDLITLSNHLRDRKQLDAVGGAVYLSQLVDNVPSAANISHYARIVKEKSVLRSLIGTATEILNRTYGAGATWTACSTRQSTPSSKSPRTRSSPPSTP
jgi:replicative DNA helicase